MLFGLLHSIQEDQESFDEYMGYLWNVILLSDFHKLFKRGILFLEKQSQLEFSLHVQYMEGLLVPEYQISKDFLSCL